MAGSISFLDRAELVDGVTALIARAKIPELREPASSSDGQRSGVEGPGDHLAKGQESDIPARGRVCALREQDLWVKPGVAFHVRTRGTVPCSIRWATPER